MDDIWAEYVDLIRMSKHLKIHHASLVTAKLNQKKKFPLCIMYSTKEVRA